MDTIFFKDPCSEVTCENEGTCQVVGNSFKCHCKRPYYGTNCEKGKILK